MVDGKARDRAIVPCDPHRTDRRCDHRFVLRIHGRRYAASARCAQAERRRMKINIEVDCTPEEARRVMGLSDLTTLHDKYVATMGDMMEPAAPPELIEQMMRNGAPSGEGTMTVRQKGQREGKECVSMWRDR